MRRFPFSGLIVALIRIPVLLLAESTIAADEAVRAESGAVPAYIWVTDDWDDYTERSGEGFYHDVMRLLFADTGVSFDIKYVPWKRALYEVETGAADTTGVHSPGRGYLISEVPVFFVLDAVLIKSGRVDIWQGPASVKGLTGVTYLGLLSEDNSMQPYFRGQEVRSREQTMKLFLERDNIDYYYDNYDQLTQTMEKHGVPRVSTDYQILTFRNNQLYWLFADTPKGRAFKILFDRQFAISYCSGELKKLYERWQLQAEFPAGSLECPLND